MSKQPNIHSPNIAGDIAAIQKMLLPQEFPDMPGYQLAVHYQPCEEAGGDFYGWGDRGTGLVGMGIADVAGHGLRAAILMAMLRTWLVAYRNMSQPMSAMATHLNNFFSEMGNLQTFVTIVLMKINIATGEYSIRNCGHPSPRLRRTDGKVLTIKDGRMLPLGVLFEEEETPEAAGVLQPGEALVFYTDGITESVGADGSFFDDERLDHAIRSAADSADAIVRHITQAVMKHRGNKKQRDDECILVVRREL